MVLVVTYTIKKVSGEARIDIPIQEEKEDLRNFIKRLNAFVFTVDELNKNLKKKKAVVTRRIEQ